MENLKDVPSNLNFAEEEERVLEYWKEIDAFKTSLKKSEGRPPFVFFDGPPFATGLPHYGHLLAGTIKDTVTRYAHQTGRYVERRFGWDCHGLPVEFEIEKKLGIKTKEEVLEMGIKKYNENCRGIVTKYCEEWEMIVNRLGRWIDFKNDYKTMDLSFMESVWWVFSELFRKDLVYKGFKVMPYSTACTTPLSNFEVQDSYKDVEDPSIVVSFPLVGEENTKFIAWTTTPWTLPSNLALCVNKEFQYVKVVPKEYPNETWIVAKSRLEFVFPQKGYAVVGEEIKGEDLVGRAYVPLFNYYVGKFEESKVFHVVEDDYVTDESGTGIVHQAPAFGEDDYRICMSNGIIEKGGEIACPLDDNGRFVEPVNEFRGLHVKDADEKIIDHLRSEGRLIRHEVIVHSYPYCYRSDTPLIYKAVPSWFVRVEQIKEDLLRNNEQTHWVPDFVKEKRFHNWLKDARDWAISRSRYWGCPIPIWGSEDGEEVVCVSSVRELEELAGLEKGSVKDIHREYVDDIEIPSRKKEGRVLRRIPDVFDCWFESGSMPYAQAHYPFENKRKFEESFPADFIAEGLDQTRGWFYTLMVLGTALFNKPPFKNLIVNGLVLAEDGRKMSKRLKNYPDPMKVVKLYGADALRLYLINSRVVKAESLEFKELGVKQILQTVFLPWYNTYRFFIQNSKRFFLAHPELKFTHDDAHNEAEWLENVMDKWILSCSQTLVKFCRKEMEGYRLYTIVPALCKFIDQLSRWYVQLNRGRVKGDDGTGPEDRRASLMTLYRVLRISVLSMAPFCPFLTETMYQNLRWFEGGRGESEDSVHFLMFPEYDEKLMFGEAFEAGVAKMQEVVASVRRARGRRGLTFRLPLRKALLVTLPHKNENEDEGEEEEEEDRLEWSKGLEPFVDYMKQIMNVKEIEFGVSSKKFFKFRVVTNNRVLGKRLKGKLKDVRKALTKVSDEEVMKLLETGSITVLGEKLVDGEDCMLESVFTGDKKQYESEQVLGSSGGSTMVLLDLTEDESFELEKVIRVMMSQIQRCRKKAGMVMEEKAEVYLLFNNKIPNLEELEVMRSEKHRRMLEKELEGKLMNLHELHVGGEEEEEVSKIARFKQSVPDVEEMKVKFEKKKQAQLQLLEGHQKRWRKDLEEVEERWGKKKEMLLQQLKDDEESEVFERKRKGYEDNKKVLMMKLGKCEMELKEENEKQFLEPEIKYWVYLV